MVMTKQSILDSPNYYVTEHFLYSDFMCPCCGRLKVVPGFYRHVSLLEQLRNEAGFSFAVTSGYRYKSHNAAVGGAVRSWYLLFATDIQPEDYCPEKLSELYILSIKLGFGGIGRYETFLHLDLRPEPMQWRA